MNSKEKKNAATSARHIHNQKSLDFFFKFHSISISPCVFNRIGIGKICVLLWCDLVILLMCNLMLLSGNIYKVISRNSTDSHSHTWSDRARECPRKIETDRKMVRSIISNHAHSTAQPTTAWDSFSITHIDRWWIKSLLNRNSTWLL